MKEQKLILEVLNNEEEFEERVDETSGCALLECSGGLCASEGNCGEAAIGGDGVSSPNGSRTEILSAASSGISSGPVGSICADAAAAPAPSENSSSSKYSTSSSISTVGPPASRYEFALSAGSSVTATTRETGGRGRCRPPTPTPRGLLCRWTSTRRTLSGGVAGAPAELCDLLRTMVRES